jgi:hypothetical protein
MLAQREGTREFLRANIAFVFVEVNLIIFADRNSVLKFCNDPFWEDC